MCIFIVNNTLLTTLNYILPIFIGVNTYFPQSDELSCILKMLNDENGVNTCIDVDMYVFSPKNKQ